MRTLTAAPPRFHTPVAWQDAAYLLLASRLLLVVYRCSHSVHVCDVEEEAEQAQQRSGRVGARAFRHEGASL